VPRGAAVEHRGDRFVDVLQVDLLALDAGQTTAVQLEDLDEVLVRADDRALDGDAA